MTDLMEEAPVADHERIWLEPPCEGSKFNEEGRTWCRDQVWGACPDCGTEPTEYIRADLHRAQIAAAEQRGREEAAKIAREYQHHNGEAAEDGFDRAYAAGSKDAAIGIAHAIRRGTPDLPDASGIWDAPTKGDDSGDSGETG